MNEPATQQVTIERMAYGPEAVARLEGGKTAFVAGGVPGDVVEVAVDRESDRFCNAHVTRVVTPSADRVVPECPYATVCGGCPWASMSYEAQTRAKREGVVSALARIGRMGQERAEALVAPLVSPSEPWGYRNKVELAVVERAGRLSMGMPATGGAGAAGAGAGAGSAGAGGMEAAGSAAKGGAGSSGAFTGGENPGSFNAGNKRSSALDNIPDPPETDEDKR